MKFKKILSVLISSIIVFNSYDLVIAAMKDEDVKIEKNLVENENEGREVKNYILKNVIKKNNGEFLIYEHEKSGATFLIYSNSKEGFSFYSGVHLKFLANKNSVGVAHAIEHCLFCPIIKKIKDVHSMPERALPMFLNYYASGGAETPYYYSGSGFNLQVNVFTPEIVNIISNEMQNPTFLNDDGKTFNAEKKRISLEMGSKDNFFESGECYEIEKERFIGGMFNNGGDAEKINYEQLKKEFKENVIPANCLISFSKDRNPNYKEIMKQFDEKWLKNFKKPKKINSNKKINSLVQTTPQREIECENVNLVDYNPKTAEGDSSKKPKNLNSKFKARLIWDLKNLTPEQKDVFRLNEYTFKVLFEEKIKKMGYDLIDINNQRNTTEFDPITFDEKFFIDFYGSNKENFKKEVLEKNAKELLTSFYEYLNNALIKKDKDKAFKGALYYIYTPFPLYSDINGMNMYRGHFLTTYIEKSFELSNNPISEKYFNIKNGKILTSPEDVIKNVEKNKDIFKILINNAPNYVDNITFTNKKKSQKPENFVEKNYEFPLKFNCFSKAGSKYVNDENKEKNLKEQIKADFIEALLFKNFLYKNLDEKGLVYNTNSQTNRNEISIDQKEYKDVEKYLLNDFKKEVKNYKPSSQEISKLKENYIKNINHLIKSEKNFIKENENLLGKKIKSLNKVEDEETIEILDALTEFKKQNNFKPVGWHKTLLEKGAKKVLEKTRGIKALKKQYSREIEFSKKTLKQFEELKKEAEKITYEDILKEFKDAKFSENSKLEEIKNENKHAKIAIKA